MVRYSKNNPRATTKEVLEAMGPVMDVSRRTVGRILRRGSLKACRPRKTPLFKSEHVLKDRIAFAKRHIDKDCLFWSRVLWTDETKIELFGHNNVSHVYRESGKAFLFPKNTVKHMEVEALMFLGVFCCL